MDPVVEKKDIPKDKWEQLKDFLHWYEDKHGFPRDDGKPGRYCLALSVNDILTVMDKIEQDQFWPNPSKKVGKMAKKVGRKVGRRFSNYNKYVIRPKTKWAEK